MSLFQTTQMAKTADDSAAIASGPPEAYRPYVGKYSLPAGLGEVAILVQDGVLALQTRSQEILALSPPDAAGRWAFAADSNASVAFQQDEAGKVTGLALRQRFSLPRAR
jgi:hypothetical protein